MAEHTKLPWHKDGPVVVGQDWGVVAVCRQAKPRNTMVSIANAEFIVRAANCHEELLAACKMIAAIGGNLPDEHLTDRTGENDAAHRGLMYCQARGIARAAIAKAEGVVR